MDGLGEGCGRAGGLLAVAYLNRQGVAAIQDALEPCGIGDLLKGQGRAAGNTGAGVGDLAVQLFGNGQGIAVGIGNGVAKVEWRVLLSQTRGAGVDGRGHIVSDRAYSGRGVVRLHTIGVV